MQKTLCAVLVLVVTNAAIAAPNIVFIMADDLGWSDVGYNGAEFYETPHIDALCRSGMRFDEGYPGAANCMPSRSCIVTGMYTPRTQMWTPGGRAKGNPKFMKLLVPAKASKVSESDFPSALELKPSVVSIAEVVKQAGYKTAHFGKWHLGPDGQGFDINDTNGRGAGLDRKFYGNRDVAEWLTDAAIGFIEQNQKNPFFVYLCHWDVHSPHRARQSVIEKYEEKLATRTDWKHEWSPTYAAMIEAVDSSVGRVHASLQKLGLAENTLFVFTSDNGGSAGITWNEPLKGAKGAFNEGGIRVPLVMNWPGTIKAGSSCSTPVTGVDYLPTFAELAGASVPTEQPVDGASVVALLKGEKSLTSRSIFWHYPLYLQGSKYARVIPVAETNHMYWRAAPCSVLRKGDWKLIQYFETNKTELFHVRQDFREVNDLSRSNPTKTAELLEELKSWQQRTGATVPTKRNPNFDPSDAKASGGKAKEAGV